MPRFVIERATPEVGKPSDTGFRGAAQKSCDVLRAMGPGVQWIESHVTGDKIHCVYHASNERPIREHAEWSISPASKIEQVIDPATAEAWQLRATMTFDPGRNWTNNVAASLGE